MCRMIRGALASTITATTTHLTAINIASTSTATTTTGTSFNNHQFLSMAHTEKAPCHGIQSAKLLARKTAVSIILTCFSLVVYYLNFYAGYRWWCEEATSC
jgi:hypothetical protein